MKEVKRWKPGMGEAYYMPWPQAREMYEFDTWDGVKIDNDRLDRGLICKTKEEAINKAELMLKALEVNNVQ